ncbi:MAG: DinB family protein [Niabella sp.]|nr:DinB family protein [Niabella sp.]
MQAVIIDSDKLQQELATAADKFVGLLEKVPEDYFNGIPFEGSWTPGQVGEHVLLFLSGIASVLRLPGADAARPADEYEPLMKDIFLNFEKRYTAPQNVKPSGGPFDKTQLIGDLNDKAATIEKDIKEKDLARICTGAPFPTIGELTGLEWVYFGIYHLARHTYQLENMQPYYIK